MTNKEIHLQNIREEEKQSGFVTTPLKVRVLISLLTLSYFIITLGIAYLRNPHSIFAIILICVCAVLVMIGVFSVLVLGSGIQILGNIFGILGGIVLGSFFSGWILPIIAFVIGMIFFIFVFSKFIDTVSLETPADKDAEDSHGSAEWSKEIGAHSGGAGDKFVLGKFEGERFYQTGHMLTCAPSGAGKGIGVVIPNLLEYGGSVFCVDIKGENFAVTSERRKELGQNIVLVDPFGVTGSDNQDAFNLMDWLKTFPDDLTSDSQMIADALVVVGNNGDSDFWNDSARDLLRGIIAYVSTLDNPMRSNIGEVRRIITMARSDFQDVLEEMQGSALDVVVRCANTMLSMDDKTRAGILTTSQQQTAFLDEERITKVLSCSTFDMSRFKNGSMSFYLVMPPERLSSNFRLIRLFIALLITSVTRIKEKPAIPALFLFDEFAQLGKMSLIEDSLSLIRGYGASYWFIIQDLSQLKAVYKKWQSFLANTTKQFFAASDIDTAKYISESLGKKTIKYYTGKVNNDKQVHGEENLSYLSRNLLNPDEVMRLKPADVLVFSRSENAYKMTRLNYLTDKEYSGHFQPNPMH